MKRIIILVSFNLKYSKIYRSYVAARLFLTTHEGYFVAYFGNLAGDAVTVDRGLRTLTMDMKDLDEDSFTRIYAWRGV